MPRTIVRINHESLQALMIREGLSSTALANRCAEQCEQGEDPITRSTVANIVAGRRKASPKSARQMARALNVPVGAILAEPAGTAAS